MHVNDAFFLVEIEDIDTGEIIDEPGRRGKMIITALDRFAQPCVRFDAKDIIEWDTAACSCGRTFRLIKGGCHRTGRRHYQGQRRTAGPIGH